MDIFNDVVMIVINNDGVWCRGHRCDKLIGGDDLCDDCPMRRSFETRHKILCAGCEFRLKTPSAETSRSVECIPPEIQDYQRIHSQTFDEFFRNNGDVVTIFFDGMWLYENAHVPGSCRSGTWGIDRNKEAAYVTCFDKDADGFEIDAVKGALKEMGYATA